MKRVSTRRMRGLSLIELLIALGIGLFMLTGIVSLVVSVSRSRVELDKTSEQIENGRYALQMLGDDLRNAGFYGVPQPAAEVYTTPSPCVTASTIADLQFGYITSKVTVPVGVYGYASGTALPSCLADAKSNSEALVVRQVSATTVEAADVGSAGTTPYVQVSANSIDTTQSIVVGKATASFTMHESDGDIADVRAYSVRTFYLADCDDCSGSGDGIPTLKLAELTGNAITVSSLVAGIEDMHIEYGLDMVGSDGTSVTHDGSPDCYVTDPGVATAPSTCSAGTWATASPNNWTNVTSVRINLLARSTETTGGWIDKKTYNLGLDSAGGAVTRGPFQDGYKRQVYSGLISLNNARGSRE